MAVAFDSCSAAQRFFTPPLNCECRAWLKTNQAGPGDRPDLL